MRSPQYSVPTTLALVISSLLAPNAFAEESEQDTETMIVRSTAEEALKQQPGVSIITAEDIAKQPPVNDLSDIIRKMPGVNLTGNSASGSRGNNRQIDIRGMGPENTLILIDGVPVTSRNSVRYSWRGERDTRGDSNWVPPEMVERIEVLRGPAAARYGSGAAGGVEMVHVGVAVRVDAREHRHDGRQFIEIVPVDDDAGRLGDRHQVQRVVGRAAGGQQADQAVQPMAAARQYSESLARLASLREPVDAFFDGVMVNADDPALRANRLGLLAKLHAAMNQVADLSKLSA